MPSLVRTCLVGFALSWVGCFAPPSSSPWPRLSRVAIETKAHGTLELTGVVMITLRSGVEQQRRVLPAPRLHDRGIPWEGIRTIVVPPADEYLVGDEEGDLLAPLKVTTKGTGREQTFLVDAGPGRKELLLRGRDPAGIRVSIDLLECTALRVLTP